MKNLNLLNRLLSYSHEKQSPQRFGRYAVMLLMLLTLGVGQAWGKDVYIDVSGAPSGYTDKMMVHYWGSGDSYVWASSLGSIGGATMYKASIPDGATNWQVCRGDALDGNKYNYQTGQTYATNNKYSVTGWDNSGSGSKVIGMIKGGYMLFDNSQTQWSESYRYFVIGHDSYYGNTGGNAASTLVTNTKLWSIDNNSAAWPDAKYFAFISHKNAYPSASKAWSDIDTYADHKTSQYTSAYNLDKDQIYLCIPSSGAGKPTFTINWQDGYSDLNKTVTLKAKVSTNGGSTYSEANTPGALSATSYKFSAWNTCGTQDASTTGSVSAGSASGTFTAGYTANTSVSAADVTGYDFVGWYEGSTLVLDGSRTGTMNPHGAVTLYAYYKVKQYTVSYGVNSSTRYGSITLNSGSSVSTTSSSTLNHGTAISFTASPSSGYQVEGWYSDAACTVGNRLQEGGTSYNAGTLTSAKTVYVKFKVRTGGTITLSAGANGEVSADNSSWGTTKTITDVTTATDVNIYARGNTGYQFSSWTKSSGSGTIKTNAASGAFTTVAYEDATVTASFSEIMSSLSTSCHYDVGNPSYAIPTKSVSSIGISTTADLTAAAPGTGYTFAGWTLSSNIVVTSGNAATDRSITIRTNGNGAAATAQANYTEDLSSPWTIKGGTNITGNNWSTAYNMTKKSGHSTESVVYYTFNISSTNSGVSGSADDWSFKVIKDGSTWYGLYASGSYWWERGTSANQPLTGEQNIQICADVAGPYEIKVDYTTPASPKVTVTFPTSYTLTYSIGSVAGTSGSISTSPTTASGSKVLSGTNVTLTGPAAKTGYTWKGWYTNAAGTDGKIPDTDRAITVTMNANKTLYACYTENNYIVTVNAGAGGSVASASVTGHKDTKVTLPTATADPGYYFTGWTTTTGTLTYTNQSSATAAQVNGLTAAATVQANFAPIWRLVGSMNSWNDGTNPLLNYSTEGGKNYVYVEVSLNANTQYSFKVKDVQNSKMYKPTSSNTEIIYANKATAQGMNNTVGGDPDQTIMTAAAGTYRFTWNITDKSIKVTYPTSYKVTFGKGTGGSTITASGSTTGSISSGDYVKNGEDVTFTETHTTGYTLTGWYTTKDAGGSSVTGMGTSDFVLDDIAADATVYSRYSENMTTVNLVASPTGKGTFTSGGDAVTSVLAGVTTHPEVTAVPATGYRVNTSVTVWAKNNENITLSSTTTNPVTISGAGTVSATNLTATFTPKTYTITLNQNGATTSSDPTSLTATYDGKANGASDQFTLTNPEKTGYTFAGWYENEGGSGAEIITTAQYYKWEDNPYVTTTGLWQHDGNVTVYAKWTPNNYAVTLSTSGETGYGSSAPSNQTATYGAAMPTITPPVGAAGYKFQGYFTGANGTGTKYYNANGTSAHTWDIAEATTLHAYFLEATITSLEHETSVAKAEKAELVVNPVLNVVPENYIAICWTLHYADNNNPVDGEHWSVTSYTEGGTKPNQVKFTFTNLANGNYYVKATLRKSASAFSNICTDGTKMMDIHGDFHVVGNNTVTVRYMTTDLSSDFVLKAPTEVEVEAMSTAEVTAPEIPGYTFTRWSIGDGISTSDAVTANPITISATYDGVLTARYAKKKMVYFNNTVGWDTVFVYFYNGAEGNKYWGNTVGTGANKEQTFNGNRPFYQKYYGGMKRVAPGSNIWYFDYLAAGFSEGDISSNISFAAKDQAIDKSGATDAEAFFSNTEAIFRDDFDPVNLPMYVPLTSPTETRNNTTKYYDQGYWMNYPESTGYELRFYNKRTTDGSGEPYELIAKRHKFEFTGDKTLPMSVSLDLEAGHDYFFKIYRVDDTYYGNNGQMTNGHSGDEGQPAWEFKTSTENAWVTASGAGNYTFTLTYGIDLSSNYNYLVGVRYPESTGDFRVLYSDAVRVTNHDSNEGKSWLASYVIPKTTESDTVSFFVREASTPKIKAQKCTATYDEGTGTTTVTWTDENEGANLLPDTISADGVYNFIFTKEEGELVLSAVEPYTGNFYIRVDGAGSSNWDNFRAADHLMPYSDYSFHQTENPYSHYFTQWYEPNPEGKPVEPKNIKFVVANDYSACVSDTIIRDGIADNYVDANGWLSGRNANIRFMYNYKTNEASRRYIDGAQESGSEFLLLIPEGGDMIFNAETDGDAYSQVTFSDKGNWLYEANVWVVPGTTYKLKSNFGVAPNLVEQYFKGAANGDGEFETLVGGSGESRLQIRLLYDFKTNRIVSAYVPSSTISDNLAINADVMFIREGQGEMQQLTFENDATLSAIKNVYSVLRFNKWTLNNRYTTGGHGLVADPKSIYERSLYFVSFPFDVKLSDVFGFGTYWDEWYIEYYDGAARAKNGFWIDSDSYWKYVTPAMKDTFTLKAGQGYIFGLDLDYLHCEGEGEGQQANVWKNIQTADFIFPGNVNSISNSSVTYTLPAHTCTINRGTASGNRTIADSHWNVLGVPTYLNTTSVTFEETTGDWMTDGKPKYIYSWNPQDNSLTPTSAAGFTYHSMNAYVVQYYGNVTFSTSVSAAAAPRRNPEYRGEYEFRLEIQKNDEALDQTYVRLSDDEEVTANFEFGYDLTKAQTGRAANLYTIIEGYLEAAGNTLPLTNQTTIVPVGVKVNAAGDFTFSMPDGTEGIGVTLIDNETGISTQLSALDYTINLAAGTYNNRFLLVISPIVQNPTGIEDVTGDESQVTGARKVIIDQKMYIIRDGKMFDAQGRQVK